MNIGDTPDLGGGGGVILALSFLAFGTLVLVLRPRPANHALTHVLCMVKPPKVQVVLGSCDWFGLLHLVITLGDGKLYII